MWVMIYDGRDRGHHAEILHLPNSADRFRLPSGPSGHGLPHIHTEGPCPQYLWYFWPLPCVRVTCRQSSATPHHSRGLPQLLAPDT
jgi:hypothetical protein